MTEQTFNLDGLRCPGCVTPVGEALLARVGARAVDVTLGTSAPSVRVEADQNLDVDLVHRYSRNEEASAFGGDLTDEGAVVVQKIS